MTKAGENLGRKLGQSFDKAPRNAGTKLGRKLGQICDKSLDKPGKGWLRYKERAVADAGAVFIGVMRGRASEGADFKVGRARGALRWA